MQPVPLIAKMPLGVGLNTPKRANGAEVFQIEKFISFAILFMIPTMFVCVCEPSVCECVCHQIQALAGTSKCVIITIIGRVNRESLKRIRFRLLRNVTVFSCRSKEYILCIIYTICLRTSAIISVTLKLRLIRFILFIVEKIHCSALGIDGNYEVDNILKIESRKS